MTTPDWQAQDETRRMRLIEEALGHIEAAGHVEEAATLREGLGWPFASLPSRPVQPFDDSTDPF